MSRFLDPRLECLTPYTPGEQPQGMDRLVKLNTNELPFAPPPSVVEAAAAQAALLHRYNDPDAAMLVAPLAKALGVGPQNLFVGNGSDEVLAFCFQGYGENGVAFADLTYGFYPVYASLYGVKATVIPLEGDFTLDLARYDGLGARAVFIANPNAPTGITLPAAAIEAVAAKNPHTLYIIDEAYVKFGGESCVPLTERYENILVVGTFSKAYALAGARLGYAVGSPGLIADLNRLKYSFNPYSVNRMTQAAGAAALAEEEYFASCVARVMATRQRVSAELAALGFTCTGSSANFLFARHKSLGGEALYKGLRQRGVLVRWFNKARIRDWLRITVGTDAEMDALLAAIRGILG